MSANLVLHWHLDALTPESRAVDTSGNHLNGLVIGDPKNQPDERFGSVLRFGGSADGVTVADTPPLRLTTYTVEAWVKPDPGTRADVIGKPPGDFRVILGADGSVQHRFATTDRADDGHATAAGAVGADAWRYVAVTNDGRTARILVDGIPAAEYTFTGDRVAAQAALLVGTDGRTAFYAGLLAHVRVYDGALSDLEIKRDMADDEAALAAFVRSHPIDFTLTNQDQQSVLYIDDSPAGQPMTLRILNTSRQDITPQPLPGEPSAGNHHYALHLRAGTLAAVPEPRITDPGWSLLRGTDPASGETVLYLKGDAPPVLRRGESQDLHLQGLNADGADGSRGTRVELTYQRTAYSGERDELTGTRIQFLDIVNHRGLRAIPLAVGFVGGNRVISDGVTASTLRIRLANVSRDTALPFRGASFTVSIDVQQAGETHEWALVDAGHAARAVLGGLQADKVGADWSITSERLGQRVVWTLTPRQETSFAPGGSIVVTLSEVVALASLGQSAIVIGYRNIPGYQDGSVTLLAEKAPLLFSGQNVGIGTATTGARLTVGADSAHLQLRREPSGTGGRLLFLELYQNSPPGTTPGNATPCYPSLRFHHSSVFWHRIEGRPEGLMFKTGDLASDTAIDIFAGTAHLDGLSVGGVTIGAQELTILKRLAAGQLQFDLWNVAQNEYAYAADYSPFDNDRRYVFTWRTKGARVNQGRWQISYPG
ncbi:LamG-like jellyroll fold domain-containing protein [Actinomadura scrupuli]|uniref:LamG domain-containing protein n=1 Tax=Actinomadura scrupuli TaxID=559629 RepID=UPI003D9999AF